MERGHGGVSGFDPSQMRRGMPLELYANHLEKECRAKQLKVALAAMQQAACVSNTTITELRAEIEELSRTFAQSRADRTREVEVKEETLHAVLEASAAEANEFQERLAAAGTDLKDRTATVREQAEQLKMKDQALAAQRHKLAETEGRVRRLQHVLQEVLSLHDDYKTKVGGQMATNRAALEKYKAAAQGCGRSRSPPQSKTARVQQ